MDSVCPLLVAQAGEEGLHRDHLDRLGFHVAPHHVHGRVPADELDETARAYKRADPKDRAATRTWAAEGRYLEGELVLRAEPGSYVTACVPGMTGGGNRGDFTVTDSGGEIVVLSSGGYGPVLINKSVSIIAPEGIYAGISVFSGSGKIGRGWEL